MYHFFIQKKIDFLQYRYQETHKANRTCRYCSMVVTTAGEAEPCCPMESGISWYFDAAFAMMAFKALH